MRIQVYLYEGFLHALLVCFALKSCLKGCATVCSYLRQVGVQLRVVPSALTVSGGTCILHCVMKPRVGSLAGKARSHKTYYPPTITSLTVPQTSSSSKPPISTALQHFITNTYTRYPQQQYPFAQPGRSLYLHLRADRSTQERTLESTSLHKHIIGENK